MVAQKSKQSINDFKRDVIGKGMEKIEIYRFQLENIKDALRVVANTYKCRSKVTCLDRMVTQSEKFAENALEGNIDKYVEYN